MAQRDHGGNTFTAAWKEELRRRLARIIDDHVRLGVGRGAVVADVHEVMRPEVGAWFQDETPFKTLRSLDLMLRNVLELIALG